MTEPGGTLRERVSAFEWYHTIELAPGVVTPGWFDHRELVAKLPFPADLSGTRCLDVGTFDGFWAFEMERRGAAEVVAVDLLDIRHADWPAGSPEDAIAAIGRRKVGDGFVIARDAIGSSVRRVEKSVYDLDPDVDGVFDFVYLGSLLLHLRDPVGALMRVRRVCRGTLMVVDAIDPVLTLFHPRRPMATLDAKDRPWWWKPNLAGLVRMVEAAGFETIGNPRRFFVRAGRGQQAPRPSLRALLHAGAREVLMRRTLGDPHGCVLARPAPGVS